MVDFDDDDDGSQGNLPDPDWERFRVRSRAYGGDLKAVGDPLRWGGSATLRVTSAAAPQTSEQFIRAQAGDTYGRLWALTGTVRANLALWNLPVADWILALELSQGSGQATIRQVFDLRALATIGMAGGYAQVPEFVGGGVVYMTRSFAIIGGVVGQQWAGRAFSGVSVGAFADEPIVVSIIACPLAAGTGL